MPAVWQLFTWLLLQWTVNCYICQIHRPWEHSFSALYQLGRGIILTDWNIHTYISNSNPSDGVSKALCSFQTAGTTHPKTQHHISEDESPLLQTLTCAFIYICLTIPHLKLGLNSLYVHSQTLVTNISVLCITMLIIGYVSRTTYTDIINVTLYGTVYFLISITWPSNYHTLTDFCWFFQGENVMRNWYYL